MEDNLSNSNETEKERYDIALVYLDKLFNFFPEYEDFDIDEVIHKYEKDNEIKGKINKYREEIVKLLIEIHYYAEYIEWNMFPMKLTDNGRSVKNHGGHFKYQELLDKEERRSIEIKEKSTILTELQIRLVKFETTFGNKYKTFGFIIAVVTLIVSISVNFFITKQTDNLYPNQQVNQKIDSLIEVIHKQEKRITDIEEINSRDSIQISN